MLVHCKLFAERFAPEYNIHSPSANVFTPLMSKASNTSIAGSVLPALRCFNRNGTDEVCPLRNCTGLALRSPLLADFDKRDRSWGVCIKFYYFRALVNYGYNIREGTSETDIFLVGDDKNVAGAAALLAKRLGMFTIGVLTFILLFSVISPRLAFVHAQGNKR